VQQERALTADEARNPDCDTTNILGYDVTTLDPAACARVAAAWLEAGVRRRWAACINPHSYAEAEKAPAFRDALHAADMLLPDGAGIVLAARLLGRPVQVRVTGSDLFSSLHDALDRSSRRRSVFLLGSTEATLAKVRARLEREHPRIRVAGTHSPPFAAEFSPEQDDAMVAAVNRAGADVLWVSMTAPKQELWIQRNMDRLDVGFAAAVGAVFDFYAGNVKRSNPLAQRLGLEWLPRLLREPRRLWKRTLISAPIFLIATARVMLRERASRRGGAAARAS
jgi:N-acetylglucosaminyldiphosphoundecaprenol N-acetyl-beta-D-mannosaminyltransferase